MFAILYKSHALVTKQREISLAKMYEDVDLDRSGCKALRRKSIWSVTNFAVAIRALTYLISYLSFLRLESKVFFKAYLQR